MTLVINCLTILTRYGLYSKWPDLPSLKSSEMMISYLTVKRKTDQEATAFTQRVKSSEVYSHLMWCFKEFKSDGWVSILFWFILCYFEQNDFSIPWTTHKIQLKKRVVAVNLLLVLPVVLLSSKEKQIHVGSKNSFWKSFIFFCQYWSISKHISQKISDDISDLFLSCSLFKVLNALKGVIT